MNSKKRRRSSRRQSENRSKDYIHLFKYPKRSRFWVYRRFSGEKGEEFYYSTGEETSERLADDIGGKAYHEWLGLEAKPEAGDGTEVGIPTFGPFAQAYYNDKEKRPEHDFSRKSKLNSRRATEQLIEAFGHLTIDQVTAERVKSWCNERFAEKPQKFFNRLKELREILGAAHRAGHIRVLPKIANPDKPAEEGQWFEDEIVERLLVVASPTLNLLIDTMWRQGPRPAEALQYRFSMIRWDEGAHGQIHIPGEITKTRRGRVIPLNSVISARWQAIQDHSECDWIFESPNFPGERVTSYRDSWERTRDRAISILRAEVDILRAYGRGLVEQGLMDAETRANARKRESKLSSFIRKLENGVLYDLRATFVTNKAKKGDPILMVAKYIDSSIKMIEPFYAKVEAHMLEDIAE
jgi:integrase